MEMSYVAFFPLNNVACAWSEGNQTLQTVTRMVGCLRLCDKSWSVHPQRSTEKQWRGIPNNTLPRYSQAHHSGHQLIEGLSTQAQKSTRRQAGTQVKDSDKGTPYPGPFQGCPRWPSAPVSRCEDDPTRWSVLEHLLQTGRGCCLGV